MKNLPFILGLIIIVLIGGIYVLVTELNDVNRVQQTTIDGLKRTNEKQRDSLERQLTATRDSLSIAFETIRTASAEREEAHKRTQATIRNLQKIIFVQHSDSSRTATLKELYKSYTP